MCRLLAYAAPRETTVEQVIGTALTDEFQHMTRVHSDGWGTSWLAAGPGESRPDVESMRISTPGQRDPLLSASLTQQQSRARLVHLRLSTDNYRRCSVNTHPFVHGDMAFAHNGSIAPVEHLTEMLSEQSLNDVAGHTDSERYFALIRQEAKRLGSLESGAVAAVRRLRAAYPTSSLNAVLLTPDELIVLHASSTARTSIETFKSYGIDPADLPIDHTDEYYRLRMIRQPDGTTLFASSGLDTAGWQHVPEDTVTRVNLTTMALTQRRIFSNRGATGGAVAGPGREPAGSRADSRAVA